MGRFFQQGAACSRANGVHFATLLTMTEDLSPQPPPPPPPVSGPTAPSGAPPTPYAQPPYGAGPYASGPYGSGPYGTGPYGAAPYGSQAGSVYGYQPPKRHSAWFYIGI